MTSTRDSDHVFRDLSEFLSNTHLLHYWRVIALLFSCVRVYLILLTEFESHSILGGRATHSSGINLATLDLLSHRGAIDCAYLCICKSI